MADAIAHAQALRSSTQYRIGDAEVSEGREAQDHPGRIAECTRLLRVDEQDGIGRVRRSLASPSGATADSLNASRRLTRRATTFPFSPRRDSDPDASGSPTALQDRPCALSENLSVYSP